MIEFDGPINLEGATVTLNSQGFIFIRFAGYVHDEKLTPSEFYIFKGLIARYREVQAEIKAKSAGAVNGWQTKAKAKAAAK